MNPVRSMSINQILVPMKQLRLMAVVRGRHYDPNSALFLTKDLLEEKRPQGDSWLKV